MVSILIIWVLAVLLIWVAPKNRQNQWLSFTVFSLSLGYFSTYLSTLTIDDLNINAMLQQIRLLTWFAFNYITPYAFLIFCLTYADVMNKSPKYLKRGYKFYLMLPMILTFVFTQILQNSIVPRYLMLFWGVPYYLLGTYLLIKLYIHETSEAKRIAKQKLCILLIPASTYGMFANYIERMPGNHSYWYLSEGLILFWSGLWIYYFFKYGILDVTLKIKSIHMSRETKVVSSGIASFNHTLKNELAKISICSKTLQVLTKQSCSRPDVINKNLEIILRSITFLDGFSTRIREYSEEIYLKEEEMNIGKTIDEALLMIKEFIILKKICIIKHIEINTSIYFDNLHLCEILMNILKNAVEASQMGQTIEIRLYQRKKIVKLVVRDYGKGIRESHMKNIFTPFFTTKEKNKNFGLGLSYCFNVMQKHGGSIDITSAEGSGTKVTLIFNKKKTISLKNKMKN